MCGEIRPCKRWKTVVTGSVELDVSRWRHGRLGRHPQETVLIESYIFNSNKCFAFFPPNNWPYRLSAGDAIMPVQQYIWPLMAPN